MQPTRELTETERLLAKTRSCNRLVPGTRTEAEKAYSEGVYQLIKASFTPRYAGDSPLAQWAEWRLRQLNGEAACGKMEAEVEGIIVTELKHLKLGASGNAA